MPHLILAQVNPVGIVMTILGLGGLVFFHELGHFLACRLTGTRVETFSIGFGPKVFGWRSRRTLYKVGLIPLGGYVKMAAENPGEEATGAPDELPSKSFSQRLFIFTAGVIFNALLAFLLFVWAFGIGVPFPVASVGNVTPGSAGWEAGLRHGDEVTHIDGRRMLGFIDILTEVSFSGGDRPLAFTVRREGKTLEIPVMPRYSETEGRPVIGVEPLLGDRFAAVEPGSPVALAGGREGDRPVAVDAAPVQGLDQFATRLREAVERAGAGAKEAVVSVRVRRAGGEREEDLSIHLPLKTAPRLGVTPYESPRIRSLAAGSPAAALVRPGDELLSVNGEPVLDLSLLRQRAGEEPLTVLRVRRAGAESELRPQQPVTVRTFAYSVAGEQSLGESRVTPQEGMPAAGVGLRPGDRVLRLGKQVVHDWDDLLSAVRENGEKPTEITFLRDGEERKAAIVPTGVVEARDLGWAIEPVTRLHKEGNILRAMGTGWERTVLFGKSVLNTIHSLFTKRVSTRHIGGPIAIAQTSYSMWEEGLARFLYVLAIISINLAILNILPVPILDGGQVVFLIAEKIRGKPLPERVVGIFQMVGLALILCLVVLAFKNDITHLLR